jgi:hypothetical protein
MSGRETPKIHERDIEFTRVLGRYQGAVKLSEPLGTPEKPAVTELHTDSMAELVDHLMRHPDRIDLFDIKSQS